MFSALASSVINCGKYWCQSLCNFQISSTDVAVFLVCLWDEVSRGSSYSTIFPGLSQILSYAWLNMLFKLSAEFFKSVIAFLSSRCSSLVLTSFLYLCWFSHLCKFSCFHWTSLKTSVVLSHAPCSLFFHCYVWDLRICKGWAHTRFTSLLWWEGFFQSMYMRFLNRPA